MKLIDADALYALFVKMKSFGELTAKKAIRCVEEQSTVDAVPVIRCKDCKHFDRYTTAPKKYQHDGFCQWWARNTYLDYWCCGAKRRDNA